MNEEKNLKSLGDRKKVMTIIGVLVLALIIVIILVLNAKKSDSPRMTVPGDGTPIEGEGSAVTEGEDGEPIDSAELDGEVSEIQKIIESSRVEAPGAALITEDNRVINESGVELRSDAPLHSPEAPMQTLAIGELDLAAAVIKIEANGNGFEPNEFTVKAGAPTTISLAGNSGSSHVLIFEDPALKAVMLAVRDGETRAITFKAPGTKGEYRFFCDFPGHSNIEVGKMIVE